MRKIAIAIHGGANSGSEFLDNNIHLYEEGLRVALTHGNKKLLEGATAIEVVESVVMILEDNPIFNAGRGSVLNNKGEVEMDAAIMDGSNLRCGSVAMVQRVKNPISLAKAVMQANDFVMIGANAALDYALDMHIPSVEKDYFITERQFNAYKNQAANTVGVPEKSHGTVGAVAVDQYGNIAAATSTGGTSFKRQGRIGDSCIIGAGCYANNKTCAISATGDGEYIIRYNIAHDISAIMEYTGRNLQEACDYVIHKKNKDTEGEIGVIAVDAAGNTAFCFNTKVMCRAAVSTDKLTEIKIYR
jgi:beta-aspartyl-peptidase (threonine type)